MIKKVKNTTLWKYVITDLNGEGLLEYSRSKCCRNTDQQNLGLKKQSREKVVDLMENDWALIIHSISGLV